MHVVAHVAFCSRCGQSDWWSCIRAAQVILCEQFNDHQCQRAGIRWYIPERQGPPTLLELASYLGLAHLFGLFPCTSDGYRIERPEGVHVADILDALDKFHNQPAQPKPNHAADLQHAVHRAKTEQYHDADTVDRVPDADQEPGNNGRNPAHHNMADETGYDA